jgi:hypothetical protein
MAASRSRHWNGSPKTTHQQRQTVVDAICAYLRPQHPAGQFWCPAVGAAAYLHHQTSRRAGGCSRADEIRWKREVRLTAHASSPATSAPRDDDGHPLSTLWPKSTSTSPAPQHQVLEASR